MQTNMKQAVLALVALGWGLASGYLYLKISDLMILAVAVLIAAMALGAAEPRRPWLAAILLSLAVPAAAIVVRRQHIPVYSGQVESALVAGLASAILGAYAGAFLRHMLSGLFKQNT